MNAVNARSCMNKPDLRTVRDRPSGDEASTRGPGRLNEAATSGKEASKA